jgi:glycosyltransferase involved in cell wall biosynthesis
MNNSLLVSIVIPVYNGANFLKEAIDSALAQTYANIEILVINDGSADEGKTRNIALSYGDKIRYFEKINGGVSSALNLGIKEMKGEYFSWLSHDDVYFPKKIETQIKFLEDNKLPMAITYTDFCCINNSSEITSEYRVRKIKPESFKIEFILGGLLHGCTLLIPKKCFEICGNFSETLIATQDFDLWFKFAEANFAFYHIPEILVKWRLHDQQVSVKKKELCDAECNLMYTFFLKKINRSEIRKNYPQSSVRYYLDYANKMLDYGYSKPARYAFFKSPFGFSIFNPKNILLTLRTGKRLFKSKRTK